MGRIVPFEQLKRLRDVHAGKKIVHCHGVFDLFHYGHMLHLRSAKKFGDVLVITVTPDRYVNKGPGRPRYGENERAQMLAALELVDYVAINATPKAMEAIAALRPHYYVKGPDYRDRHLDITGGIYEEEDAVRAAGGELVFTDDDVQSSTELINRYFSVWDEAQANAINQVKAKYRLDEVLEIIERIANQRILVVGEPIVDTYVFCEPMALSSKSPTVSARFLNQEDYAGGSLAIANHLKALGCDVSLLITHGNEPYFHELLKQSVDPGIRVDALPIAGWPTPRKTRYLAPFRAQKMFEIVDLRSDQWEHNAAAPFRKLLLERARGADVMVVADFGHGLFENEVLKGLESVEVFKALNVQTNSANMGFNLFTKHRHYDYVSIDEREFRLGMHDRYSAVEGLVRNAIGKDLRPPASVTLGTGGSLYFTRDGTEYRCPVFFKDVVDTTGAGDAYFAITSILAKLDVAGPLVPFIGNCYAGLKTRIMGNKAPVRKVDLIRTVKAILS